MTTKKLFTGIMLLFMAIAACADATIDCLPGCEQKTLTLYSDTQTLADGDATAATWNHPDWPHIAGATWIWPSYRLDSESKFGPYAFTREFSIPGNARKTAGTIRMTADNAYELFMNGKKIGGDGTVSSPPIDHAQDPDHVARWSGIETYSFTPVAGNNELLINAVNYRGWVDPDTNPAGVLYRIDVSYEICTTTTTTTSTTSTTYVRPCPEPVLPVRSLVGISSAQFVEQTDSFVTKTYGIAGAGMVSGNVDLSTSAQEEYDFFLSDADGTPNGQGSYITSVCDRDLFLGGIKAGHNLDSVALVLSDGTKVYADWIASYSPGSQPYGDGHAGSILGETDGGITYLGDGNSRITVGFCDALKPTTTTSTTTTTTTTLYGCGNLKVFSYNDYNGNGVWETGEPALGGSEYSVEGPVSYTLYTDSHGEAFKFCIPYGEYVIEEDVPEGWESTSGNPKTAVIDKEDLVEVKYGSRQISATTTTTTTASTTTTTEPDCGRVAIYARGVQYGGVLPVMQLWIDGRMRAQWNVLDDTREYSYDADLCEGGHSVDAVFTNADSGSRDLYVYRVLAGGALTESDDSSVSYDKGSGSAAFDGYNVIAGQSHMDWNGALRFKVNGGFSAPPTTQPDSCSLAGDYFPCGYVTIQEVVDVINKWVADQAEIGDVIALIYAYKESQ